MHMVQLMLLHPKPRHLLPHLNPDWFYLSVTSLATFFLGKRPLNMCSSSTSSCSSSRVTSCSWLRLYVVFSEPHAASCRQHVSVRVCVKALDELVIGISRKTLHASQPVCLSELISHYLPHRSLRSSNTNLLTRPPGITSNFSSQAFSVSAPSTWNSLPAHIRSVDTLFTFKRHLKFHLFQSAFTV